MTGTTPTGRRITPGHPLSYSTPRNARAAEYQAATREGRRRRDPERCAQCDGYHLAGATDPTTTPTGATK